MKTQLKTENLTVTLAEIDIDKKELMFTATVTRDYMFSTDAANITSHDIDEAFIDRDTLDFEFIIAPRYNDDIYCGHGDDSVADYSTFSYVYGDEICNFIKTAATHFNLPLYEHFYENK